MRKIIFTATILGFIAIFAWPSAVSAQDRANAIVFKGGVYQPTDDLDDWDSGFNGEFSYNRYFSPNFALEVGVGYFETEITESGFDPFTLGTFSETDEITTIPVTVNVKAIAPLGWGEFYGGAGLGIYFADFDGTLNSSSLGTITLSDSDTVFGAQLLAGLNINLTHALFLGVEGKIIYTDDAEVSGTIMGVPVTLEGNLTGYTISGLIGFRF